MAQEQPNAQEATSDPPVLGRPAPGFGAPAATLHLPVGTKLWSEPSEQSLRLGRLEHAAEAEILERRGAWTRVRHHDRAVWVGPPQDPRNSELEPGTGADRRPRPRAQLEAVDPLRLERAVSILSERLGAPVAAERLGPFELLTDLPRDSGFMNVLRRVGEQLVAVYEERYAAHASEQAKFRQVLVLFSERSDFDDYTNAESLVAGLDIGGHAAGGVAAMWVGEGTFPDFAAILLHEAAHLFAERAFPYELPPWLEEGLAEDFSLIMVSPEGVVAGDRLRGQTEEHSETVREDSGRTRTTRELLVQGPRVALGQALDRWRRESGPQLDRLADLTWPELTYAPNRGEIYVELGFLVRFLVEEHQSAFTLFLDAAVRGGPTDYPSLLHWIGLSDEELREALRTWATFRAVSPLG